MNYFSKFILVGICNTVLGYIIIFSLMYLLNISPEISNIAGYSVGLIVSYFLNRNFTFQSTQAKRREFLRFFLVFCIAYVANFLMLEILIYEFGTNYGLSQILAGAVYILFSFFMNKSYVFERITFQNQ